MAETLSKQEAAASVYRWYAELMRVDDGGLGGRLLLAIDHGYAGDDQGTDPDPERKVRAASIAGAASLLLVRTGQGRAMVRTGVCDFLVNTLDEALRILKNELRLRHTAAVCLACDPPTIIGECITRGLQPDLLAAPNPVFLARGALLLAQSREPGWRMATWTMPPGKRRLLPILDELALHALGASGQVERRRWMHRAPQYLGPGLAGVSTLPMDTGEAARFAEAAVQALREQRVPAGIQLTYGEEDLLRGS